MSSFNWQDSRKHILLIHANYMYLEIQGEEIYESILSLFLLPHLLNNLANDSADG